MIIFKYLINDLDYMTDSLEGILHLYSETGTEGGHWAFQDSLYVRKNVNKGYCTNCGIGMQDGGPIKVQRVVTLDEKTLQELSSTGKLSKPNYCSDDKHVEEIGDAWDYKGLHILKDGDQLTIYNRDDKEKIEWSGIISLKQHPLFTEDAFGWWIHADQNGIEREVWAEYFLNRHPARLIPFNK